jgi:hypothetical protein
LQDFILKLRDHLLGRIHERDFDGDTGQLFSDEERNSVRIRNNTIYRLATLRVNYTTYDMRRDFDTVNPKTHPFIMVPSPETEQGAHLFWYAAVLGVFHADVQYAGYFMPMSSMQATTLEIFDSREWSFSGYVGWVWFQDVHSGEGRLNFRKLASFQIQTSLPSGFWTRHMLFEDVTSYPLS